MARAGTTTPFWWGSSITSKQANYDPSAYPHLKRDGSTVAVDSFEPNPLGPLQCAWQRLGVDRRPLAQKQLRQPRRRSRAPPASPKVRGGSWYALCEGPPPRLPNPSQCPRPQRRPGFSAVQNFSSLILTSLLRAKARLKSATNNARGTAHPARSPWRSLEEPTIAAVPHDQDGHRPLSASRTR